MSERSGRRAEERRQSWQNTPIFRLWVPDGQGGWRHGEIVGPLTVLEILLWIYIAEALLDDEDN